MASVTFPYYSSRRWLGTIAVALTAVALAGPVPAQAATEATAGRWVASWATSPTAAGTFPGFTCPSAEGLQNQTVRNIVFSSTGGNRVRVRLANTFGTKPLRVGHAAVALSQAGAATVPGSERELRFGGQLSVTVPAGAELFSDLVTVRVRPLQNLTVSVYLPDATGPATQHLFAQQINYLATGDNAVTSSATSYSAITCWLFVDGVDVTPQPRVTGAVVALGDSITDGALSTPDTNRRWPDDLARRLDAVRGPTLSVVNAGISGNEILLDRQPAVFGPSALSRLDRDVLAQSGARVVILLEGINDIGGDHATAVRLIGADQQIIARAHARGLRILGGTLTPFGGSHDQFDGDYGTAFGERQRQELNRWIRTSGAFDGVIDFDAAVADPANPERMLPLYDSGDHLHPGDAGYAAMANAIPLRQLLTH